MIVEHELIEQIEADASGRPLAWIRELLASLGKPDPLAVLQAMHGEGFIELRGRNDTALAEWQCRAVFRGEPEWAAFCRVCATGKGSRRAHG